MTVKVSMFKEGDEKTWLQIVNASIIGLERKPLKLEDIEKSKKSPYFDPKGVFFAYVKTKPVGLCCVTSGAFFEVEKGYITSFHILPEYRGTKIENVLHKKAVNYLKSKGLREVEANFSDDESYLQRFFSSLGYRIHRVYLIMKRNLQTVPFSKAVQSLRIQPLKKSQLQLFVDVANKAFSDAFSYYDFEPATVKELKQQMQMHNVAYDDIKIAFLKGEPIGYVYTSKDNVAGIGVVREHRRKGIASALLLEGLRHLHHKGSKEAFTGVNEQNKPAVNFFIQHGFQESKKLVFMRKTLKTSLQTQTERREI